MVVLLIEFADLIKTAVPSWPLRTDEGRLDPCRGQILFPPTYRIWACGPPLKTAYIQFATAAGDIYAFNVQR